MSENDSNIVTGMIIDEEISLTLDEVCRACATETTVIVALVEEGVLEPSTPDGETDKWVFSGSNLRRARIALRLRRDLEINLAGIALMLDLLDEIESLRAGQLGQQ
jgi:chaperone modulatory protein CbpM